jgi:hypothetical protein
MRAHFDQHRGRRKVFRLGLTVLLAALLPALAMAHGPSRKKEIATLEVDAPAEKAWAILSNYADMSWHPDIAKTEMTGEIKPDVAKRVLTFKNGAIVEDGLLRYEPEQKLISFMTTKVDLKTLPVDGFKSQFEVKEEGGKTVITWLAAFYRGYPNNDPPPELSDEAAIKAVTAFQKRGLDALKAKLEAGG